MADEISLGWLAGQFALGVGGGAVALAGFGKLFISKWIEKGFRDKEEAVKHEREKEIAALKDRINRQFDRVVKLSQREFEVLPALWEKIADAYTEVRYVSMALKRRPHLSKMSEDGAIECVKALNLSKEDEDWILGTQGDERDRRFFKACDFQEGKEAQKKVFEAHDALDKCAILLPEVLAGDLRIFKEMLRSAVADYVFRTEHSELRNPPEYNNLDEFINHGEVRFAELENIVRARLSAQGE